MTMWMRILSCILTKSSNQSRAEHVFCRRRQEFMVKCKFTTAESCASTRSSRVAHQTPVTRSGKVSQISPTNVDFFPELMAQAFQSPHSPGSNLSFQSPNRSPHHRSCAVIPKRRFLRPQPEEETGKGKRRRRSTTKRQEMYEYQSYLSPSPKRVGRVATASETLFSPGQQAAFGLISLRHAFSPCKQKRTW
jgi:hypothetical protein